MTRQEYLDEHGNDIPCDYDPADDFVDECAFCGEPIDRFDDYFQIPGRPIRVHEDCLLGYVARNYKLADIARRMGFEEVET